MISVTGAIEDQTNDCTKHKHRDSESNQDQANQELETKVGYRWLVALINVVNEGIDAVRLLGIKRPKRAGKQCFGCRRWLALKTAADGTSTSVVLWSVIFQWVLDGKGYVAIDSPNRNLTSLSGDAVERRSSSGKAMDAFSCGVALVAAAAG